MKRRWTLRGLALGMVLALGLPAAGIAEELGEVDLYDPTVYAGEVPVDDTYAEPEPPIEPEWVPVEPEAEEAAGESGAPAGEDVAAETEAQPEGVMEEPAPAAEALSDDAQPVGESVEALPGDLPDLSEAPDGDAEPDIAAPESGAAESAATTPDVRMGLGERIELGDAAIGCTSDNPQVVALEGTALVAAGLGTARVSVGTDTRVVEVLNAPEALAFEVSGLSMGKGERRPLAVKLPENSAAYKLTYASSKPGVVAVDESGNLYAKKTGTAKITATAFNGAKASCTVKVAKAPSKLTLSPTKLVLNVGGTRTVSAKLPKGTASLITWASSGDAVSVDAEGKLTGVMAGNATITARTFNKKKATCKVVVIDGSAPTSLSLGAKTLSLGKGEKYALTPALGEGEAAVFAYSSGKKSVAKVSSKGVITAKKAGTAKITVKTHNGLKATLSVKVVKAPSKVTLSSGKMTMNAGETETLKAKLPKGTASQIAWESSDAAVVAVDANGLVTAVGPGEATVRAKTFNGKTAKCKITVNQSEGSPTAAKMVANLRASSLGAKKDAIASVVGLLISAGFEPAFAAGVGANVYSEGTYGMFESSKYIKNYLKRPRYFCYLDGGDYYTQKDGEYVLTAVYMAKEDMASYTGEAEARERFGAENYYRDNFSGKYVQNIDLNELETFMNALAKGKWEGKFGVGIVQWTGGRTMKLLSFYRQHAGAGSATITAEQVMAAENEMILYDFKGDYAKVYTAWLNENAGALDTVDAAYSGGALVCTKYEIPVDKNAKAIIRGNKAKEIYQIMVGGD